MRPSIAYSAVFPVDKTTESTCRSTEKLSRRGWPRLVSNLITVSVNMSIAILPLSQEFNWNSAIVGLIHSSFFWGYFLTQVDSNIGSFVAILPMSQEFNWNSATVGLIHFSFFWGYLLTQILGDIWEDKISGKLVLGFGVIWWSATTVLTPIAARVGLPFLLVMRAFMGIGESSSTIARNHGFFVFSTNKRRYSTPKPLLSQQSSEAELLVVVGSGAAGIYGAIRAKTIAPNLNVVVIEKGKPLSKVKISGGGRCNVTNGHCSDNLILAEHYPRGNKELGSFFSMHGPKDTMSWFFDLGVKLKTEDDGRVFPVNNNSSSVVDCLLSEAKQRGGEIFVYRGCYSALVADGCCLLVCCYCCRCAAAEFCWDAAAAAAMLL